jgi:hypothetical protein
MARKWSCLKQWHCFPCLWVDMATLVQHVDLIEFFLVSYHGPWALGEFGLYSALKTLYSVIKVRIWLKYCSFFNKLNLDH